MNTITTFVGSTEPPVVVAGEVLEALVRAVTTPPDPGARSAVICSLVHTMFAAVSWLQSSDTTLDDATNDELASLGQVATAAQDHQLRMSQRVTHAQTWVSKNPSLASRSAV
jgi:hypothetical protein